MPEGRKAGRQKRGPSGGEDARGGLYPLLPRKDGKPHTLKSEQGKEIMRRRWVNGEAVASFPPECCAAARSFDSFVSSRGPQGPWRSLKEQEIASGASLPRNDTRGAGSPISRIFSAAALIASGPIRAPLERGRNPARSSCTPSGPNAQESGGEILSGHLGLAKGLSSGRTAEDSHPSPSGPRSDWNIKAENSAKGNWKTAGL